MHENISVEEIVSASSGIRRAITPTTNSEVSTKNFRRTRESSFASDDSDSQIVVVFVHKASDDEDNTIQLIYAILVQKVLRSTNRRKQKSKVLTSIPLKEKLEERAL